MNIYIVIPAHNEEAYISKTLDSLSKQTLLPKRIVVVNDHSSDSSQALINSFCNRFDFIDSVEITSQDTHAPGSKVIEAFYRGFARLDADFDILCKFDADLIFPKNYLERIAEEFKNSSNCGMVGGHCYIEKQGQWQLENLTNKDHIRGALKAYKKDCFNQIGGLKRAMGWDTVDELLAKYHNWEIVTCEDLHVKHLKPTGNHYKKEAALRQGKAFYTMRYGWLLSGIAALKLALKKQQLGYFWKCMKGYYHGKKQQLPYLVSETEGQFIRNYRWSGIKSKFF